MQPASFPQGVYPHVYFAFGSIDPDTFEVVPALQSDETLYQELKALQTRDLGQELWLSIGGWAFADSGSATATTFSDVAAADEAHQQAFFASLTLFMLTWGFNGVDIDWEYPAATDRNGRPEDYKNFPTFLANLCKVLDKYNFGLSVKLPTSYWYLQHFDLTFIKPSVDWFNYMSTYLSAHTNLTKIETTLDLLWHNNITASKVNLGLAFYGRSFTLASGSCTESGCKYLSAGDAGSWSDTAGILFNSKIADIINDNNLSPPSYKDAAVKAVSWDNDQWVPFDDKETFKLKGDFAKSQCLGGVLVWSVDYDDSSHTYSKGLAAALGNKLNVDVSTGVTVGSFGAMAARSGGTISKIDETATTTGGQEKYCHFLNCSGVCLSGFTTVYREDKTPELMLDSTHCPSGSSQTQTLCCPTASEVPTCRWRGFHNNGHCKPGCNDGEVEVGTVHKGCSKGYQSACCTITESTKPRTKCQWTTSCSKDKTCQAAY
ncbi:glycoside hydrolase superfamily [Aspergillus terricola var. indicus]